MSLIAIPLAALAGGLTILSPCILPIAPVVLTSAVTQHRHGGLALALGLGVSFAAIGLGLTLLEAAFGFDASIVKQVGGVIMVLVGIMSFLPKSVDVFAMATGPVSAWAADAAAPIRGEGLAGQFGIGALLALIWSPCVGPTLGAAFALSSSGQGLGLAAATMLAFAFGASTALLGLGFLVRSSIKKHSGLLKAVSSNGRVFLGASMVLVGGLVLTGLDEVLGTMIVAASPDWIVSLTTRF
jgi:cytochrome c-type biogenesis protein